MRGRAAGQRRRLSARTIRRRCGCGSTTTATARASPTARRATGPGLALFHSLGLSHREWEPVVEPLSQRFRVVLPDLPLHGDSEDRPRHPYTPDWLAEVVAGFCAEVLGPRPLVGGHDIGAELLLRAVLDGRLTPRRLVLMPNRLHRRAEHRAGRSLWRGAAMAAAVPGSTACSRAARRSCSARRSARSCRCSAIRRRATSCATRSPTCPAIRAARARGRSSRARWPSEP